MKSPCAGSEMAQVAGCSPIANRMAFGLAALVALVTIWPSYLLVPTNVDVSWLLIAAGRLLDGARLHVDVVELNPPFSIWLYMPFVVAERAIGLRAELWVSIAIAALSLASLTFSSWVSGIHQHVGRHMIWLAPAATFVLAYPFPYEFAQREHIATIMLLPWLALQAARLGHLRFDAGTLAQRVVAGIGAALFLMIKPPWSAIALGLVILSVIGVRRSLRPAFTLETVLAGAVSLAYVIWFLVSQGTFFSELFGTLREVYFPMRLPFWEALTASQMRAFALLLLATLLVAYPARPGTAVTMLLVGAAAYVPVFLIMGRGWTYHALPFLIFGCLALLTQIAFTAAQAPRGVMPWLRIAVGFIALVPMLAKEHMIALPNAHLLLDRKVETIGRVIEQPSVGTLATRLQPAHPLTRAVRGSYVSRFPGLWMVENAEAIGRSDPSSAAELRALQERYIVEAANELQTARPDIIVAGGERPTPGQDLIDQNPQVRSLLTDYSEIYRDPGTSIFARRDLLDASPAPR